MRLIDSEKYYQDLKLYIVPDRVGGWVAWPREK